MLQIDLLRESNFEPKLNCYFKNLQECIIILVNIKLKEVLVKLTFKLIK